MPQINDNHDAKPEPQERPGKTSASNDLLYGKRDIEFMDEKGGFYFQNLMAMTAEGLHSKSAIAAELGYRDCEIYRLEQWHTEMQAEIERLQKQAQIIELACEWSKSVDEGFAAKKRPDIARTEFVAAAIDAGFDV